MPSPRTILLALHAIANDYWYIAATWHVLLGAALIAVVLGWRPSRRMAGSLLAALPASVGVLAALGDSPFNAAVFAVVTIGMLAIAARLPRQPVALGPPWAVPSGAALLALGWVYPHFLETTHLTAYLIAAPMGAVPCPTLLALVGITLLADGLSSRPWCLLLAAVSLLYGVFGVAVLGVSLDAVLLGGALLLLALAFAMARPPLTPARVSSGTP